MCKHKSFIVDNNVVKIFRSPSYKYIFKKDSGVFYRWGETEADNPVLSPFGPEIADVEITTKCGGIGNLGPCKFCYKSNTMSGSSMSLQTFQRVFRLLPKTITQIAFGVDAKGIYNPEMMDIFRWTREQGVIPNVTIGDISEETATELARVCGAVAVSRYEQKDFCYNSVERLSNAGLKQVNIHQLLSKETLSQAYQTIEDAQIEPRLKGLNAIVFLSLKQKGRGKGFTPLSNNEFNRLMLLCLEKGINFGLDSCSSTKFISLIEQNRLNNLERFVEPCEALLFSVFCNTDGEFFPCSFCEGEPDWEKGIHYSEITDFIDDFWFTEKVNRFRKRLLDGNRSCPNFNV